MLLKIIAAKLWGVMVNGSKFRWVPVHPKPSVKRTTPQPINNAMTCDGQRSQISPGPV